MKKSDAVTIIKLNIHGEETWRYSGIVMAANEKGVLIEAFFNRDDLPFHGITLKRNDRFLEVYFYDRWYNIYEIYDRDDDTLKGWYCNITKPVMVADSTLSYVDMALDLLVFPDGRMLLLDENEYQDLNVSAEDDLQARAGLSELKEMFNGKTPFRVTGLFDL